MSDEFEKVQTENPLLDEIVYNVRKIVSDGVVLKDQVEADKYETVESVRDSDLYIAAIDGNVTFNLFTYFKHDLRNLPINNEQVDNWAGDNTLIPNEYRDILLKQKISEYISNYEEENRYYRCLNGQPSEATAVDNDAIPADDVVMPSDVTIPYNLEKYVDMTKPLYLQDDDIRSALEVQGVFDEAMEKYNAPYLLYAGKRKISIYDARRADKFAPLYIKSDDVEIDVYNSFEDLLNKNRIIYLRSYYDQAYEYKSDYYDKFIIIMIILQTVTDAICQLPEYYIRKDLFDLRTIEYYFGANGVEFFPDIPIRYQISLVRNLNRLIKYKSSDYCIEEILKLFGFDNIKIYKYYIIRSRKLLSNGRYSFEQYNDEGGNLVDDIDTNFDLKFLKVPIDQLADDAIKSRTNILPYDGVVADDIYWDGENEHHVVKRDIKKHDFNLLRTKYITVNSVYSMQQYVFQMTYFMNILFNNNLDKEMLMFNIPYLSVNATIVDSFVFMYALAHIYYGTEDIIVDDVQQVLAIMGFNFEANFAELSTYLADKFLTAEDVGIDTFIIPKNGIFTFNQLMYIYTQNKNVYDHVVHEMLQANNKRIYDIYKHIYDALMVAKVNQSYFTLPNGEMAKSFREFLRYKNDLLAGKLEEYAAIKEVDKRQQQIATCIYNVACTIENYIDVDQFPFLFTGLPSASIESVKSYAKEMIAFFKSFKVEILDINLIFRADDKLQNTITCIDDWRITDIYDKHDVMPYMDRYINQRNTMTYKEDMSPHEEMYITSRTYQRQQQDRVQITDKIKIRPVYG